MLGTLPGGRIRSGAVRPGGQHSTLHPVRALSDGDTRGPTRAEHIRVGAGAIGSENGDAAPRPWGRMGGINP